MVPAIWEHPAKVESEHGSYTLRIRRCGKDHHRLAAVTGCCADSWSNCEDSRRLTPVSPVTAGPLRANRNWWGRWDVGEAGLIPDAVGTQCKARQRGLAITLLMGSAAIAWCGKLSLSTGDRHALSRLAPYSEQIRRGPAYCGWSGRFRTDTPPALIGAALRGITSAAPHPTAATSPRSSPATDRAADRGAGHRNRLRAGTLVHHLLRMQGIILDF